MFKEEDFDKKFEAKEDMFIKWNCKSCSKENREFLKDNFTIANISTTACYDCGTINILDLKSLKHVQ